MEIFSFEFPVFLIEAPGGIVTASDGERKYVVMTQSEELAAEAARRAFPNDSVFRVQLIAIDTEKGLLHVIDRITSGNPNLQWIQLHLKVGEGSFINIGMSELRNQFREDGRFSQN